MKTDPETGLVIDGVVPALAGLVCDDLICQEYRFKGEVHNPVNVTFLRFASTWHRLWFDADIVFWRVVDAPDDLGVIDDFTYTLIDLGQQTGVCGKPLADVLTRALPTATEVRLSFADGTLVTFTYEYGPGVCTWEATPAQGD